MREQSETPENAEAQQDDGRGLGAEPVAVTEGAAAKPFDEPDSQHSNLATLEGRGLPVEAAAPAEVARPCFDERPPDGELLVEQLTGSVPVGQTSKYQAERLMDGAVALYLSLKPHDPFESILARLIVAGTNASLDCLARATKCDDSRARETNLRHGLKGTMYVDSLIKSLESRRGQGRSKVTVGQVKVEAGGQAIVGNVETGGDQLPSLTAGNRLPAKRDQS